MSKYICSLTGLFGAALVATAPAYAAPAADCDLVLQELGGGRINGYDALAGGDYIDQIRLRLRNKGDGVCNGVLRITRTASFDRLDGPESSYLDYTIVDPTNIGQVILDPISQQTQGLPVSVGAKSSIDIFPRLLVPGGQSGRQGRYFATLQAQVDLGPNQDAVDREFTVSAQVLARVQANFAGGRNATLDLGELAPNVVGSISMQIRSSADIDVEVSSENEGNLVRSANAYRIPYSMTFDSRPVDLGNGSSFNVELQNSVRGQSLPVVVTVGAFSNAPVGAYGDVVTFRISAR
ncbi:MAG: hypothetical protein ABI668_12435 [Sphingorhabdus sp.]